MSKADQLGDSDSFAAVTHIRSARRRLMDEVTGEAPASADARTARLADLAHNPCNPRQELGDLQETADSLLERGQIQPVTVATRQAFLSAHPGCENELGAARYVVLDGNRRLAAARLAGLEELRIDVNDALAASAADILESALVANLHRENLTPLEEAEALAALVKVHGSQRQAARRVGKTHVWVSQRLALLDLTPDLRDALHSGDLTVEDARQVARLPQDQQAAGVAARQGHRRNRAAAKDITPPSAAPEAGDGGNAVSALSPLHPAAEDSGAPQAPAPARTASPDAATGNGVSSDEPAARSAGRTVTLDWEDLPAVAELLRQNLDSGQREKLASLITADS
jgi:ParB family chromosome partitioning protein